jgi:hypothetical protein
MTRTVHRATLQPLQRCAFTLATAFICGLVTPVVRAEVHIEGTPTAVRITASQDAISDVLSAVATTFNVRFRTSIPLDAAAKGTYSGSLGQVISRLLDGYSYVIKKDQDATEIIVVGRRGDVAPSPWSLRAPPTEGIVSRWR